MVVRVHAGNKTGLGYSYAHAAGAHLVHDLLAGIVKGKNANDIPAIWREMVRSVRNIGRQGIAATAISAVDSALWDLKARLLELALVGLLGRVRDGVPVYGSGGFTSYSIGQLQKQLSGWVKSGISRVKMKVGTHPEQDAQRVQAARDAIGKKVELFIDANGAYSRRQALPSISGWARRWRNWAAAASRTCMPGCSSYPRAGRPLQETQHEQGRPVPHPAGAQVTWGTMKLRCAASGWDIVNPPPVVP